MIEAQNIKKSFDEVQVLKGIDAVFEKGKTNLIIGASGSGKTVFIKCLVGLFEVDSGGIFYDSTPFHDLKTRQRKTIRKQIGMLFQGGALFDSLTVEENVKFPLDMFTSFTDGEKLERVNEVLEKVNLAGSNAKYPGEISGGMMKRVGIARAIVLQPKYLFCDEPNSGLDPQTAIKIDQLIFRITKENDITTIINTHDMNSVMEIGEQVVFLHKGHKHWEGSNKDILNSDNKELNDFIFASKFLRELKNPA